MYDCSIFKQSLGYQVIKNEAGIETRIPVNSVKAVVWLSIR